MIGLYTTYLLAGQGGIAQTGKSYSVMDWVLKQKHKKGDMVKIYWLRLTDTQQKNLLKGGANRMIDPDLRRKYGIANLKTIGDTIYTYEEEEREVHHKDGTIEVKKKQVNQKELIITAAASTMANNKGVAFFDTEFEKNGGEYILVLDEMNREVTEKNTFDICRSVARMVENLVRDSHTNIKFFMIGNDIGEASDLLTAFNFLPNEYGRYKLKRQKAVIDYIAPNEQYKRMRKQAIAAQLSKEIGAVDGAGYDVDRTLIVNKRKRHRPVAIIKFGKTPDKWFTLWNDSIIAPYNNETIHDVIAMRRYLDASYQEQLVNVIHQKFSLRLYKFISIATFKQFQSELRLLKK